MRTVAGLKLHFTPNSIYGIMGTDVRLRSGEMKLLDLYCKAGGAGYGYHQAGFEVVGVDIQPQPNYPFKFIQADAIEFLKTDLSDYDVIHASPPCQAYSWSAKRWKKEWPDLVEPTRELLKRTGKPYIIENVVGAPLIDPLVLCGTMFGLKVIRHRLFESNIKLYAPCKCNHKGTVKNGDYVTVAGHGGDGCAKYSVWCKAMGIDWMTKEELTQAIPPCYTKFIGEQLIDYLKTKHKKPYEMEFLRVAKEGIPLQDTPFDR
jgi:DNA (cytosine-5)-methyltransferase 1